MFNQTLNRRGFLAVVAAVAVGTHPLTQAVAAEKVSPDEPIAKSLAYTEDSSRLDPAKATSYKKGSHCAGCALYQAAQAKGGYAPCAIFQNKLVSANGWCKAYAAKT